MGGFMTKQVLIAVAIGLLLVAAVISYFTNPIRSRTGGIPAEFAEEKIWVICTNDTCKATYEMNKKAYFEWVEANAKPMSKQEQAMKCQKCGKDTAYGAEKCTKCGEIFHYGGESTFPDKCPKCGYSPIEEGRKRQK
jgi:hypothetical protein